MLMVLLFAAPAGWAETPALQIGTIAIHSTSLFSGEEESHGGFYEFANRVHQRTPEALVRKFLLFREGDPYVPALIAETERNLRALDFIKIATIAVSAPHDGRVDVRVDTQDQWTSDPNFDAGKTGQTTTWSLNVTQKDLFGTGSEVSITGARDPERLTRAVEYIHPAFIRPYWNLDAMFANNSDGGERKAELARPFFSSTTRWSIDILADHLTANQRTFREGEAFTHFRTHSDESKAILGWSLSATPESATRLLAGFDFVQKRFASLDPAGSPPAPDDRMFRFGLVGLENVAPNLLKMDYVDWDARMQDFDIGRRDSIRAGFSPGAGGARRAGMLALENSGGLRLGDRAFLLHTLSYEGRFAGGPENQIASGEVRLVWRPETASSQTLVSRLRVDAGWRLDRDVQFFADVLRGLRAYPAYSFEGDRSVILNLEDRIFLGRELAQIVAPGAAVFVDAGAVGSGGPGLHFDGIKSDVGAGLRFAIARANNTTLRLDMAYALNDSATTRRGWIVSFGTAQAF